jgi:hypothetical protein
MRIIFCCVFLLLLGFTSYSQTWTVQGGGIVEEYTIISKEQFDRIIRANETIAIAVSFVFADAIEVSRNIASSRVIKGTRPNINGYYYMTVKAIPEDGTTVVVYGNSGIGRMIIVFYKILLPGTISLRYNWNEYVRQYNQLIRLVNNE